jgi:hypothetical protein
MSSTLGITIGLLLLTCTSIEGNRPIEQETNPSVYSGLIIDTVSFETICLSEAANESLNEAFMVVENEYNTLNFDCVQDGFIFTVFERHETRVELDSFAMQQYRINGLIPHVVLHGRIEHIPQYTGKYNRWLYCDSLVFMAVSFDPLYQ